jgi:hypothetical protein
MRSTLLGISLLALGTAHADPAPFDLAGPNIEVEVTRGERTLPAAQVPNLSPGDRLWMKADLPTGQSAHYLMVAAFLRGATNPPPAAWFFRCETWTSACAKAGLTVTVPKGAEQLLLFLAPQTGGDFNTLVSAVRGRPGAFVRTSQDLNQATLDRSRLDAYLAAVRRLGEVDPSQLREAAPLLARSLAIKVDEKCLEKMPVLQAPCLAQGREALILDDGHSVSIAQQLTSGPASDLAMEASNTPQLKSGNYGPFIGSIFDIARILDSFRTARYQYFPALTSAHGRELSLTLNAPPSFHDPKSVLVVALPAVEVLQSPPLHTVNPTEVLCARKDPLVLPVEGAPLVFSTGYAHDLVLRVVTGNGAPLDLPARPDAARGGLVVETTPLTAVALRDGGVGSLRGQWGFDPYEGPSFKLVDAREQAWKLAEGDAADVIVGRADTIHLRADNISCLDRLALLDPAARQSRLEWKKTSSNEVEVRLPLQEAKPGELTLLINEFGRPEPQHLALHAFAEAGHLDLFTMHAGDTEGVLRGNRLDEVGTLTFAGVQFTPGTLSTSAGKDELVMLAQSGSDTQLLKPGAASKALVVLQDGRSFDVKVSVDAPRPSAVLIGKTMLTPAADTNGFRLANENELPLGARLTFSLRAQSPPLFTHNERVEVATTDGLSSAVLGLGTSAMVLQGPRVAVATLDPAQALGSSAFGPLRFRRVVDGVAGEWHPLATLVRLPSVAGIDCPATSEDTCSLSGSNLFLFDSISSDPGFTRPTRVPDGFTGQTLRVPHPVNGQLYVKLRDDPGVVSVVVVDVKAPPSESSGPDTHAQR